MRKLLLSLISLLASNLGLSTTATTMESVLLPARSVSTVVITLKDKAPGLKGDVNGDGVVDVADLNLTIDVILGLATLDKYPAADVNGDGDVDVADANAIINTILGL